MSEEQYWYEDQPYSKYLFRKTLAFVNAREIRIMVGLDNSCFRYEQISGFGQFCNSHEFSTIFDLKH